MLLLVFGILLMIAGAALYVIVEVGSHGNYSLIPHRADDLLTLLLIAGPVVLGGYLVFRARR